VAITLFFWLNDISAAPPYSCWCCRQRWTIDLQMAFQISNLKITQP